MQHSAQIAGKGRSRERVTPAAEVNVRRMCIAILVALSLIVSGMAAAMPLSKAPGGAAFVICAGNGPSTIYLDRNGKPVAPMKDCANCPDCLLPTALPTSPSQGIPERYATYHPAEAHATGLVLPAFPHLRPETRGPPPVARECLQAAPTGIIAGRAAKDSRGKSPFHGRTNLAART
jgi:hypothetical protein